MFKLPNQSARDEAYIYTEPTHQCSLTVFYSTSHHHPVSSHSPGYYPNQRYWGSALGPGQNP